ncbi:MAG: c-type cytochrome [Ferruginibacter sp.]
MPAYPWMFSFKKRPAKNDIVVNVPKEYLEGEEGKIVATEEGLQLVAYLQSLKQASLPDGKPVPSFLYRKVENNTAAAGGTKGLNGATLYAANCQSCHQPNGEGLKGAFPPLKGSTIVLNDNPEMMVNIIMNGYNGRINEGYGIMPPVGTNNNLTPEEIAAIMNHEKESWGNSGKKVTPEEIKKLIGFVKLKTAQ